MACVRINTVFHERTLQNGTGLPTVQSVSIITYEYDGLLSPLQWRQFTLASSISLVSYEPANNGRVYTYNFTCTESACK